MSLSKPRYSLFISSERLPLHHITKTPMKYFIAAVLIISTVLSCSEEFNLIAPKQETPVVFGFLSVTDTAQYIRVQRAFRDAEISAVELAQIPDSIYYTDATVTLTDVEESLVYTLDQVDGNTEGYPKEDGAFANDPNILYKVKTEDINLVEGHDYTLTINTGEQGMVEATSTITLGEVPDITTPKSDFEFFFGFDGETNFAWKKVDDIKVYDVILYINIKERDISDVENEFIDRQLRWEVQKNVEGERLMVPGLDFYQFLLIELEKDPLIARRFLDMECEIVGAGQELLEFVNVANANTGITSSGETPIYSNIDGGLGLFSTRNSDRVTDIILAQNALDSLQNSTLTQELNFQ